MPRLAFRATAFLAALSVAACATGPGPAEVMFQTATINCNRGVAAECENANRLYPAVLAEQGNAQTQANAVAVGAVALGVLGILAGAAIPSRQHLYIHHRR